MAMRPRTFVGARNSTGNRQQAPAAQPIYEDFKPKSEWIQDQESDSLLIYLPGFTKESLKVSTQGRNILRVGGERLVTANKWQRFQEDFHAPDYCNMRGTHARFEGGILTIRVPKNTITPPPKQESKPTQQLPTSSTTSQKTQQFPNDRTSQKVQETISPKNTNPNQEDKAKSHKESHVPPKPISPVPPTVPKDPMSEKVQEIIPPKITTPNKEDKAKAFQESPVSPNPISPVPPKPISHVSDDKRKHDQTFSTQENLHSTSGMEQKQKVDSGASKNQETLRESKALQGQSEMEKERRIEQAAKSGEIMEGENKASKPELTERRKQDSERIAAQKTEFVDDEKTKYPEKMATSSWTGHLGVGNYKKVVKSLANMNEERKLLVNMGAAVMVFMALGAYIYHTVRS